MLKHFFSFLAGAGVLGDTVLPLLAGDHIAWLRWRIPIIVCAFVALVGLAVQLILQYREDRAQRKERDDRDRQLPELIAVAIAKRSSVEKITPLPTTEEQITNVQTLTPHEQLLMAQEAIFVEGILAMPADDLRINLGHDLEFKQKYNAIPKGKYSSFDTLRVSMAPQPIIASKFVRAHLMPRSPYADMVRDIFRASGRTDYETSSDFLFEIHAVNTTDNVTTIQKMVAEAEIGGKWVQLPLLDDLSNYQLVFDDSKTSTQGGKSFTTKDERVEELNSFWEKIKGVPFNRGIGYQGWVGFELTTQSAELSKPVMHKVRLIDAFGGTHPVVNIEPPDTKGRLQHSPKAYNS